MGLSRLQVGDDVLGTSSAEDNDIKEGVCAETVGTVHRDTGGFTSGVETGDDLVVTLLVNGQDFSSVLHR